MLKFAGGIGEGSRRILDMALLKWHFALEGVMFQMKKTWENFTGREQSQMSLRS
jgi:hypothetical protein